MNIITNESVGITMKNWESLFREHILERGHNYFISGAVSGINKTLDGYTAVVEGTEDYEVEIELQADVIGDMYCTCPYAEDGKYCKHMAAVLYSLANKEFESSTTSEDYDMKQKVQMLLEDITEAEVKKFLLELAADSVIATRIIAQFSKTIGKNEVEQLKSEVDNIVYRYAGREGFIYYRDAYDFISEMGDFLYQKGQVLIDNKCNMQAFEVITYVFMIISNQDMDDSDGGTSMVANICYELWEQILEQCDTDEKDKMFQWFQQHQKGYVIDFMEEYLSDFLMNHFDDKDMLLQKLQALDDQIAAAGTKTDCGQSWSAHYGYENNLLKRLEIMKCLSFSDNEIKDYRQKFRKFSAVRKLEAEEYLVQKQYDKAIDLLVESKELDKEYPGLLAEYSSKLIVLYQKLNMIEEYKNELVYQVFSCRQNNLEYVKKLKQCCPEEWDFYLEKLLVEPGAQSIKYELLKAERLYRRLLDEILKSGYVYSLDQYEKCLKKEFPNEVRDAYVNYTIRSAESATDRKTYKQVIAYLKKIRKYPQGEKEALKVVAEWKGKYKRRPAMMDELRKAGF